MRRGRYENFDPTKLLPGEWAVVLSGDPNTANGMALYHCFAAGSVKRIATIEDAATIIANATEDIRDELTQDIASALAQVGAATNAANTATANANTATSAANAATQAATSASERAEDAIDAMGDISELAVPEMSADVRGGAKLEQHGGLALRDGALGIGSLVQESDGYARGGLAEVTAKGHAEQVSTTGKNLLDVSAFASSSQKGNCTVVASESKIVVTPTASSAYTYCDTIVSVTANSTYCISSGQCDEGIKVFDGSGTSSRIATIPSNSHSSFTPTQSTILLRLIGSASGITEGISIAFNAIQLEHGSTATEYEPYTGGLPSPRPDWEQPIEVVRGRNLIPNAYEQGGINPATGELANDSNRRRCSVFIPVKPNAIYTVTRNLAASNSSYLWFVGYKADKSAITDGFLDTYYPAAVGAMSASESQKTFTTTSTTRYVKWYVTSAFSSFSEAKLQLESGYTPHPYVPYGHVGMEVQGKNLLNESSLAKTTSNGVVFTPIYKSNGLLDYINVNGKATSRAQMYISNIRLPAGTYTVSMNTGVNVTGYVAILKPSGTVYVDLASVPNRVKTFTIEADYICTFTLDIVGGNVGVQINNARVYPQLELGTEATPYEPPFHHTTPIPLPSRGWVGSLPDGTADTLTLDGAGKIEWERKTNEVVYDGDEVWAVETNKFASGTVPSDFPFPNSQYAKGFPAMCNAYRLNTTATRAATVSGTFAVSAEFMTNSRASLFIWDSEHLSSASAFNTWLQSNPITILYPLATSVIEDCGYVNMPSIPSDATVTIPELDALGIRYFVDDTVTEYGREIIARGQHDLSDTNGEIDTLEASIAPVESVVATSNHAVGDYFMLGNVLMRTTTAIATGERITTSNATPATVQSQIDTLRDSVSPTPFKNPAYTAVSGVTVHTGTKWTRIGHLVVLYVQVSVPDASNGTAIVTFSNIPTPSKDQNYFTASNAGNHRGLMVSSDKTLRPIGDIASAGWLSGTCIYTTDELI